MPSQEVRVVAQFAVKPECVDEFVALARELLVRPTQSEPGCIAYELCQDLADRTRFAMVEAWESEAALAKHLSQPSLQAGLAKLAPMAAGTPSILRLRPV